MESSLPGGDVPINSVRRRKTRDRLLDAAFEVFAEQCVHAASVEMICERAGFTRGAFYSNFSAKEELFFSLMQRENELRIENLEAGVVAHLGPLSEHGATVDDDAVAGIIAKFLERQADNRRWRLVQNEFRLLAMRDREVAATYLQYRAQLFNQLTTIAVDALALVSRRFVIDPSLAVRIITELYESAGEDLILVGDEEDAESVEHSIAHVLPQVLLALTERF